MAVRHRRRWFFPRLCLVKVDLQDAAATALVTGSLLSTYSDAMYLVPSDHSSHHHLGVNVHHHVPPCPQDVPLAACVRVAGWAVFWCVVDLLLFWGGNEVPCPHLGHPGGLRKNKCLSSVLCVIDATVLGEVRDDKQ